MFDALLAAGGSDLHLGIGYPPLMRLRGDLTAMRDDADGRRPRWSRSSSRS